MRTINLYFDFEFTSLSPDAQPISVGIVSDETIMDTERDNLSVGVVGWNWLSAMALASTNNLNWLSMNNKCKLLYLPEHFCSYTFSKIIIPEQVGKVEGYELSDDMQTALDDALKMQVVKPTTTSSKSFYAEFSDFDINRCDDWVKENVVGKLHLKDSVKKGKDWLGIDLEGSGPVLLQQAEKREPNDSRVIHGQNINVYGDMNGIVYALYSWLNQFSDYQIQFVCDKNNYQWEALKKLLRINDEINGCKEIELTKGKFALVDISDFELLNSFSWHARIIGDKTIVVRRRLKSEGYEDKNAKAFMHRDIMGLGNENEDMIYVDHINGDSSDNRRCNLRLATKTENNYNRKSAKGSKSKYVGVTFHETSGKYRAFIAKGRKYKHLLSSDSEIKCAKAYDKAAKELYGEFAKLNFPNKELIISFKRSDVLPDNISPVPEDLNDLIARTKGITVREAFELNREELALGWVGNAQRKCINDFKEQELAFHGFPGENKDQKHSASWDAKIIKEIYQKLK